MEKLKTLDFYLENINVFNEDFNLQSLNSKNELLSLFFNKKQNENFYYLKAIIEEYIKNNIDNKNLIILKEYADKLEIYKHTNYVINESIFKKLNFEDQKRILLEYNDHEMINLQNDFWWEYLEKFNNIERLIIEKIYIKKYESMILEDFISVSKKKMKSF